MADQYTVARGNLTGRMYVFKDIPSYMSVEIISRHSSPVEAYEVALALSRLQDVGFVNCSGYEE